MPYAVCGRVNGTRYIRVTCTHFAEKLVRPTDLNPDWALEIRSCCMFLCQKKRCCLKLFDEVSVYPDAFTRIKFRINQHTHHGRPDCAIGVNDVGMTDAPQEQEPYENEKQKQGVT